MARVNISVPNRLKAAMGSVEGTNWSAVAQAAFEYELQRITSITAAATMDKVVERIRASKAIHSKDQEKLGDQSGREWAANKAESPQLEALELFEGDDSVDADVLNAQGVGIILSMAEFPNDTEIRDFWAAVTGAHGLPSDAFVAAFVNGAKAVWDEVKDKI